MPRQRETGYRSEGKDSPRVGNPFFSRQTAYAEKQRIPRERGAESVDGQLALENIGIVP